MPSRVLTAFALIVFCCVALLSPGAADASQNRELRLALVVTNQEYEHELIPLKYTHADGDIVAAALQRVGFDVQVLRDGSKKALLASLRDFERRLRAAGPDAVVFFYFSGHAWATQTSNYLIMDERLEKPAQSLSRGELLRAIPTVGVPVKAVTEMIGRLEAKASFVVIDSHLDVAEPSLAADVMRTRIGGKPHPGLVIAAQGRPGMPAADSNDFSKALAGALLTPGLSVREVFTQVQVKVAEDSNGKQVPWYENHLQATNDFRFTPLPAPPTGGQRTDHQPAARLLHTVLPTDLESQVETAMWKGIANATDASLYQAYLTAYPSGQYVEEARKQTEALARTRRQTSPEKAQGTGRRIALVIGNNEYSAETRLKNPHNDARAIAGKLKAIGFDEVSEGFDLSRTALLDALRRFGEKAGSADWAFVYYSGHGIEVDGVNYLVPVDARLSSKASAEDEAVSLNRVLELTADAKIAKVVVLDACRTNSFAGRWSGTGATKGGAAKGFAPVRADSGTLVAYAAEPGNTAADGEGSLNPYAAALVANLEQPIDIRRMFGLVYDELRAQRNLNQTPWFHAALGGREYVLAVK